MSDPTIVYGITIIFPDRGETVIAFDWRKFIGGCISTWVLTADIFYVRRDDGRGTILVYQVDICKVST